jgi:hypothetical protein
MTVRMRCTDRWKRLARMASAVKAQRMVKRNVSGNADTIETGVRGEPD